MSILRHDGPWRPAVDHHAILRCRDLLNGIAGEGVLHVPDLLPSLHLRARLPLSMKVSPRSPSGLSTVRACTTATFPSSNSGSPVTCPRNSWRW